MKLNKNKINIYLNSGYTLIELLVVISIVSLLGSVFLASVKEVKEKAKRVVALSTQRQLQKAVEMYYDDMGFYPPDVARGWDPGISKALPYNPDHGYDCAVNSSDCPSCATCPSDWQTHVQSKWRGPYTASWPNNTPWAGEYDYNNWEFTGPRYGCTIPPGIYIGVERSYDESNALPYTSEQWFLDNKMDADMCFTGEAQLELIKY